MGPDDGVVICLIFNFSISVEMIKFIFLKDL